MVIKSTRRKKKPKVPAGYDSKLEYSLHTNELKDLEYHPTEKINYEVPSTYEPDFITEVSKKPSGTGSKTILIEVKGRFRTSSEARKYRYIRESLEAEDVFTPKQEEASKEKELIFLFQDAAKPMPFANKRKDGTKQTHGEWADRHGFRYYCLKKGLPKTWLTDLT